MKYDTGVDSEKDQAKKYLSLLISRGSIAEIKAVRRNRTLKQNSYLHLLIAAFGDYFGYTREEAKIIYKELNGSIYAYQKRGRTFLRSSASLNVKEMKDSIDNFRRISAENGYELPLATRS